MCDRALILAVICSYIFHLKNKKILKVLFTPLHFVDWQGKSFTDLRSQPGFVSSDLFQNSTVLFDPASVY